MRRRRRGRKRFYAPWQEKKRKEAYLKGRRSM
jgi:hypothetical protein